MTYVVIESTPGYMPEDDDPATFEDITDARVYASDLQSRLMDHIFDSQCLDETEPPGMDVNGSFADSDCWSVIVYDKSREHDLGRIIEIIEDTPKGRR